MKVYVLQHAYQVDGSDEVKLIGIYGTASEAEKTRDRTARLPGFSDQPHGFSIDAYEVGRDCWTSGLATIPMVELEAERTGEAV